MTATPPRIITLKNRALIGLHAVDERGRYLKLSGSTLRSMCSGSVTEGLRKAIGAKFGEPIEIVDERAQNL